MSWSFWGFFYFIFHPRPSSGLKAACQLSRLFLFFSFCLRESTWLVGVLYLKRYEQHDVDFFLQGFFIPSFATVICSGCTMEGKKKEKEKENKKGGSSPLCINLG
ncbi:hypothetical protein MCOR25_004866 [Pyricularia grisea]|nr:hypothetical protein MCOR25_004866 [Pyricularia grisea]